SQRSLDVAEVTERNPGSSLRPWIPAVGLHPGYDCNSWEILLLIPVAAILFIRRPMVYAIAK
ncbi:MAG TPA: hypothetical protein VJ508_14130, partial [Saprospiraceae bacterium]|nr:hypothetical protein [Saprospiraceae bacterium]